MKTSYAIDHIVMMQRRINLIEQTLSTVIVDLRNGKSSEDVLKWWDDGNIEEQLSWSRIDE